MSSASQSERDRLLTNNALTLIRHIEGLPDTLFAKDWCWAAVFANEGFLLELLFGEEPSKSDPLSREARRLNPDDGMALLRLCCAHRLALFLSFDQNRNFVESVAGSVENFERHVSAILGFTSNDLDLYRKLTPLLGPKANPCVPAPSGHYTLLRQEMLGRVYRVDHETLTEHGLLADAYFANFLTSMTKIFMTALQDRMNRPRQK